MTGRAAPHAEYDDIATEYAASKQLPFRTVVEAPSLFALAGDVRGLAVLDLACGEGTYSRALARRGAARVLGIDLSSAMVERARAEEKAAPLGPEFRVGDAATLGTVGAFDLVLASYLFNYAQDRAQLLAFARTVHANLRPGGRLIGINDSPLTPEERYGSFAPYGFSREIVLPRHEGSPVRYIIDTPGGGTFHFDNFWLAPETYRDVFAEAGLAGFAFVPCRADLSKSDREPAFWQDFLTDCPLVGLQAHRPIA